jgi:hypothetical protein
VAEALLEFLCLPPSVAAEDLVVEAEVVTAAEAVGVEAAAGVTHLKLLNLEPSCWYSPGPELFSLVIANTDFSASCSTRGKTLGLSLRSRCSALCELCD